MTTKHKDLELAEIEALKLGDRQWSHAMDLAKIEIADLKAEIERLKQGGEPVACRWQWDEGLEWHYGDYYSDRDYFKLEPLYNHPVKEQSNLANVVKDHIKDLEECVLILNESMLVNTANEMKVAIKELKDAIEPHPVKELRDEEIKEFNQVASYYGIECSSLTGIQEFIRAILRKAQEKVSEK